MRIAIDRALNSAGYDVNTTSDGEKGFRIARESRPDLVLLDMMLPRVSGFEVLRAVKQDAITQDIPVVILAAF